MAILVTTDLVTIDASEATTNWLSLGAWATAPNTNVDTFVQGSAVMGGRCSGNTGFSIASVPSVDMTVGGVHVFGWIKNITWPQTDVQVNGGIGLTISSDASPTLTGTTPSNGPTNSKTWYLAGTDTDTTTGWVCYVVDPTAVPDLTLGAPLVTSIKRAGVRAKIIGTVGGGAVKPVNINWDAFRYGTGITLTGGTTVLPATLLDILSTDSNVTNAWGVLTRENSVFLGAGAFNFGLSSQTAVTTFTETGRLFVWRNFPVAINFYTLNIVGAASFPTTFTLGSYSGGLTSSGCVIKGAGQTSGATHATWRLVVGNDAIVSLYGSTFTELLSATLKSTTTVRDCTFQNFGTVTTNGALIDSCVFQGLKTTAPISATYALIVNSTAQMANITNSSFISCGRAINITTAGTYTFTGLTFSGNTYDIENSSGGAVIINVSNGGNATTFINSAGGSTTINNSVTLTLTGIVSGSEVRIYSRDGAGNSDVELSGQDSVTTGVFDYTYNYAAGTAVNVVVFHTAYQYYTINNFTLSSTNASVPVQQTSDRQYSNPL